ncbi:unnamed protein product [Caenorhabditis nigoni]
MLTSLNGSPTLDSLIKDPNADATWTKPNADANSSSSNIPMVVNGSLQSSLSTSNGTLICWSSKLRRLHLQTPRSSTSEPYLSQ